MKIDVITFHNTMNFGASLQCIALTRYLALLGHNVEVINYLPDYVLNKKSVFKELKKAHNLRGIVKGFAYLLKQRTIKTKDRKFTIFIDNNIHLTKQYRCFDDILAEVPDADVYICGSDQIWNPYLTGDSLDKCFFLEFVKNGKTKVAYGASVGELDFEKYREVLKKKTKDFDFISVREQTVSCVLSSTIGRDVSVVLDPTLLLSKEDYCSMELPCSILPEKYLLLYNIQNSDLTIKVAKRIANERKLVIVDISANPFQKIKGSIRLLDIGPGEFLTLFRNTEYVITNSFHGTVFSIIYEKNFNAILHTTRGGRIRDLLNSIDLYNRIIEDTSDANTSDIDYNIAKNKLNVLKADSQKFINKFLH